jgi:hypothetical protein
LESLPLLAVVPAALLAGSFAPRSTLDAIPVRSKPAVWGAVVTIILCANVHWVGRRLDRDFRERQQAANRAAMATYPPNPVNAPYPKIFFQKGVNACGETRAFGPPRARSPRTTTFR